MVAVSPLERLKRSRDELLNRRRRRMKLHEQLFLDPFRKWSLYGELPVRFVLHMLLVFLVTCQVRFYLEKDINHAHKTTQHLSKLLLGSSTSHVSFWRPQEMQQTFDEAIRNIFFLNDVTFNDVKVHQQPKGVDLDEPLKFLHVHLTHRNGSVASVNISRDVFMVQRKTYLQQLLPILYTPSIRYLQSITVSFHMIERVLYPASGVSWFIKLVSPFVHFTPDEDNFEWHLFMTFDGSLVGSFEGSLTYTLQIPSVDSDVLRHSGLHISVIACALVSVGLIIKQMVLSFRILIKLDRAPLLGATASSETNELTGLSFGDKISLFNWWWFVSMVSHVVQILVTLSCMRNTPEVINRFSLLGWSCCLAWVNICQYFEFFPGYYVTFSTTSHGLAAISRYMVSVLPILTGFMVLGTTQFWISGCFSDFGSSYASLFSLLNGDMVHDTFVDLSRISGISGQIYCYIFIFLFIYIVLNVNITIIEEAYYSASLQGLRHELTKDSDSMSSFPPYAAIGAAGTRRRSDPMMLPNLQNSSSRSPLLSQPHGSCCRLPINGSLSPAFLNNKRLQSAFGIAFPEDFDDLASPTETMATSPAKEKFEAGSSNVNMKWWSDTISEWTATLRSSPELRKWFEEHGDHKDESRSEFEAILAEHYTAIKEIVASASHRE